MADNHEYKYLTRYYGSSYKQYFYKERKIRAETLYRATVGPEPRTPEEVARDYHVPVEAVYEAIDYCIRNKELLDAERAQEEAYIKAKGWDKPPYVPEDYQPDA